MNQKFYKDNFMLGRLISAGQQACLVIGVQEIPRVSFDRKSESASDKDSVMKFFVTDNNRNGDV